MRASKQEREYLAKESGQWECDVCLKSNQVIADESMQEVTEGAVKEL